MPRTIAVFDGLRAAGFAAARVHMSDRGVRTDATAAELSDVLRAVGRRAAGF